MSRTRQIPGRSSKPHDNRRVRVLDTQRAVNRVQDRTRACVVKSAPRYALCAPVLSLERRATCCPTAPQYDLQPTRDVLDRAPPANLRRTGAHRPAPGGALCYARCPAASARGRPHCPLQSPEQQEITRRLARETASLGVSRRRAADGCSAGGRADAGETGRHSIRR